MKTADELCCFLNDGKSIGKRVAGTEYIIPNDRRVLSKKDRLWVKAFLSLTNAERDLLILRDTKHTIRQIALVYNTTVYQIMKREKIARDKLATLLKQD